MQSYTNQTTLDKQFFQEQIQFIQDYTRNFPEENSEELILRWIDLHAQNFRECWEQIHK